MVAVSQISEFGKILIFLIAGIIMVCVAFFTNKLLAPSNPNPEKLSSYECGEETTGNAWLPFNSRFYVIALIFLLFDVEMVFIFPWAVVFGNHELNDFDPRWGWLALTEMFVFLGILILGLAYVWRKGDLDWIKAKAVIPIATTGIPSSLYAKVNSEQLAYKVKSFAAEKLTAQGVPFRTHDTPGTRGTDGTAGTGGTGGTPAPRKPMFKPTFKKPGNE